MKIGILLKELKNEGNNKTHFVTINNKKYFIKPTELGISDFGYKLIKEDYDLEDIEKIIRDLKSKIATFEGRKQIQESKLMGSFETKRIKL